MYKNIDDMLNCANKIDVPSSTLEKVDHVLKNIEYRKVDNNMKQKSGKRSLFRPIVAFATMAAVVCLFVFGALPHLNGADLSNNSFTLQAFAMEIETSDPVAVNLADLIDESNPEALLVVTVDSAAVEVRGSGDNPFTLADNIAVLRFDLRSWGANIEKVEYILDDGFFVDGRFHTEMGGVEILGSEIVITGDELGDDFSLNFGMRLPDLHSGQITVSATSTFTDGTQAERIIIIEMAEVAALVGLDGFVDTNWVEPADWFKVHDTINATMRSMLAPGGQFAHLGVELTDLFFFREMIWNPNTSSVDFESFTDLNMANGESQIWYIQICTIINDVDMENGGFLFEISRNNDEFTVRFMRHIDYNFTPPTREEIFAESNTIERI
ncbi:MAG: hypothetical protein FWE04_05835 [Oscillospiraceae bacterium]|nr:hypothetical protein [Oscillospiraceae bacterium]